MLELIVLGQVPGTQIQITFSQVAVFTLGLATLLLGAREFDKIYNHVGDSANQGQVEELSL